MKITDIKTYIVDAFRSNWVFLKIETDEGISGYSEATLEFREKTVLTAIEEWKQYLIGKDPNKIEELHMHLERDSVWRFGPVLSTAISGIDIALWDIKGKTLGVPVYELLGGPVGDKIEIYANAWFAGAKTIEDFASKAAETVSKGIKALKWDPFGTAYLELSTAELNAAIDNVAAVRDAVGKDIDLMIEAHGRFNLPTAIRIARALEPFNIYWLEEPLYPGRLDSLKNVRDQSPVHIAAGERTYSRHECAQLIQSGCVDYIQPDISHVGGITEMKKIASFADANYIHIAPHNPMGPGTNAATIQVMATCINVRYLETMLTDVPWRKELVQEDCRFENGALIFPKTPGIGITFNDEIFDKYPPKIHVFHHYNGKLTDIRPTDAETWFKK